MSLWRLPLDNKHTQKCAALNWYFIFQNAFTLIVENWIYLRMVFLWHRSSLISSISATNHLSMRQIYVQNNAFDTHSILDFVCFCILPKRKNNVFFSFIILTSRKGNTFKCFEANKSDEIRIWMKRTHLHVHERDWNRTLVNATEGFVRWTTIARERLQDQVYCVNHGHGSAHCFSFPSAIQVEN